MRNLTLWEAICRRAGKDGLNEILIEEAVAGSAVTRGIADVEIRRMSDEGLIQRVDDERIRLTESGRSSCSQIHHTPTSVTSPSISPEEPEIPER